MNQGVKIQIVKLKKLLYLLATNVPFIPNIMDIAKIKGFTIFLVLQIVLI